MTQRDWHGGGSGGFLGGGYFLGFIGAAVYELPAAHSFYALLVGLFKAIMWPGFVVYHLFAFFKI